MYKSQLYFCIQQWSVENANLKNTICSSKNVKYSGIILTKKNEQGLYTENYKTLLRKINEDINGKITAYLNQKTQYCGMSLLPKLIYRFNTILIKISRILKKLRNWLKKSYENSKDLLQPKHILKRTKLEGLPLSDFKFLIKLQ